MRFSQISRERQGTLVFASLYRKRIRPVDDLLALVGLENDAEKRVSGYSKWMKSRLDFAKALLHDPSVLLVTGLGRRGYVAARIFAPAFFALIVTGALLPVVRLGDLSVTMMFFLSLTMALQGIIVALLAASLSSSKLEGMAIAKLTTLLLSGSIAAYLMPDPSCYAFFPLPSFWVGHAVRSGSMGSMAIAVPAAGMEAALLLKRLGSKL